MADPLTVRFQHREYYDIHEDMEVAQLMAITGKGTWSMIVPRKGLSAVRKEFKEDVLERMYKGELPCELEHG